MQISKNCSTDDNQTSLSDEISFDCFCLINKEYQVEITQKFAKEKINNRKYSFNYDCQQESSEDEDVDSINVKSQSSEKQLKKNKNKSFLQENQEHTHDNSIHKFVLKNRNTLKVQPQIQKSNINQQFKSNSTQLGQNQKQQKKYLQAQQKELQQYSADYFQFLDGISKQFEKKTSNFQQETNNINSKEDIVYNVQTVSKQQINCGELENQKNGNKIICKKEKNLSSNFKQDKNSQIKSKVQQNLSQKSNKKNSQEQNVQDILQETLQELDSKQVQQTNQQIKQNLSNTQLEKNLSPEWKQNADFIFKPKSLFDIKIDKKKLEQAQSIFNDFSQVESLQQKSGKQNQQQIITKDQLLQKKQFSCLQEKIQEKKIQLQDFQYQPKSLFQISKSKLQQAKKILQGSQSQQEKQIQQKQFTKKSPRNLKTTKKSKEGKVIKKYDDLAKQNTPKLFDQINKNTNQKIKNFIEMNQYNLSYLNNIKLKQKYITINGSTVGLFIEKFNYHFECNNVIDFDWTCNHIRQIRYKCYFQKIQNKKIIFQKVYEELVYRFWREQIQNFNSIIRQIILNQNSLNVQIVLMVQYINIKRNCIVVELTDGWYSIYIKIKKQNTKKYKHLFQLIREGKLYPTRVVQIQNFKYISRNKKQPSIYQKNYITVDINNFFPAKSQVLGVSTQNQKPIKFLNIKNIYSTITLIDTVVIGKSLNFISFNDQQDLIQFTNEEDIQEFMHKNNNGNNDKYVPVFFFSIDVIEYPSQTSNNIYTIIFNKVNFQHYEYLELFQRFQFKNILQHNQNQQNSNSIIINQKIKNILYFSFQKSSQLQIKQLQKEERLKYKEKFGNYNLQSQDLNQILNIKQNNKLIKRLDCLLINVNQTGSNCVQMLFFIKPNLFLQFFANKFKYQFICQVKNVGKFFSITEVKIQSQKKYYIDYQSALLIKFQHSKFTGLKIKSQSKSEFREVYNQIEKQINFFVDRKTQNKYYLTNLNLKYNL